jgi:hypothetical protein
VFKERIHPDKADPNILHDEMTTLDHALTRPWTVDKRYRRVPTLPSAASRGGKGGEQWSEYYCGENNAQIVIGNENYFLADGFLMPVRRGQRPPDLRYFEQKQ